MVQAVYVASPAFRSPAVSFVLTRARKEDEGRIAYGTPAFDIKPETL